MTWPVTLQVPLCPLLAVRLLGSHRGSEVGKAARSAVQGLMQSCDGASHLLARNASRIITTGSRAHGSVGQKCTPKIGAAIHAVTKAAMVTLSVKKIDDNRKSSVD